LSCLRRYVRDSKHPDRIAYSREGVFFRDGSSRSTCDITFAREAPLDCAQSRLAELSCLVFQSDCIDAVKFGHIRKDDLVSDIEAVLNLNCIDGDFAKPYLDFRSSLAILVNLEKA
jgi:hypothetical protein